MNIARTYTVALCLLALATSAFPISSRAENAAKFSLGLVAMGARYGANAAASKAGALDRIDVLWSRRSPYAWEFTPGVDSNMEGTR